MALASLATVADIEARGVTVEAAETAVVETYLAVASAAVREAAGSPISQTTTTATLAGTRSTTLPLPGRPIVSVSSVDLDGGVITDYRLSNDLLWRADGWRPDPGPSLVTVSYTHGLPTVPADIVDLVCRMAVTALDAHRAGAPLSGRPAIQERIGDYSVTYGYDESRYTEMDLPNSARRRLAARFGNGVALVRSL